MPLCLGNSESRTRQGRGLKHLDRFRRLFEDRSEKVGLSETPDGWAPDMPWRCTFMPWQYGECRYRTSMYGACRARSQFLNQDHNSTDRHQASESDGRQDWREELGVVSSRYRNDSGRALYR